MTSPLTYDDARARAERVVLRGETGTWLFPVTIMGIAVIIGPATYGVHHWVAGLSCAAVLAAATYVAMVRSWWKWAITQDVDLYLVEEIAEDRRVVFPAGSWPGRIERRVWMKLPDGYTPPDAYTLPPPAEVKTADDC